MPFVDRTRELAQLEDWWQRPGASICLVWGRRRVGKTALIQQFAQGRRAIFHTAAGRPASDELLSLSVAAQRQVDGQVGGLVFPVEFPLTISPLRDLAARPFADWVDALEALAEAAAVEPLLLVLDEFPELVRVDPSLPSTIRSVWDRIRLRSNLHILLSGSAVRVMRAIQEERAPLYGRLDLALQLHPFRPHEAALMLPGLPPAERALVWGLVGGVPLYLSWWDQDRDVGQNLAELALQPGGRLLTEGQNVLATEGESNELARRVLFAIAAGRTQYNEIKTAIAAEPARTLERLMLLQLVEQIIPVTEDPARTRRRSYRIADNFLAFFLGVLDRYRGEIERGLGRSILPVVLESLDDYMGPRWEEAFRLHLYRMAEAGELGEGIVRIGPFWTTARGAANEIDAVALAGRAGRAVLVGEAKWSRRVDGAAIRMDLERKSGALPRLSRDLRYAVAGREAVSGGGLIAITAADVFDG